MYRAPVDEITFTLKHVAGLPAVLETGQFGDLGEDLVDAILAEGGRFASDEIAPLAMVGDTEGAVLDKAVVTTPAGWKDLYARWAEGGWNALTGPAEFGGQALPTMLGMAATEMWNAASLSFGLGPMLTMGAVEAVDKHASDALKAIYLEKLVSGIQRQLETQGENEVSSKRIGEMVMDGLKGLDSVAYIRFASVYRDFNEARDFEEFAGNVNEVKR